MIGAVSMSRIVNEALAIIENSIPNLAEIKVVRVCIGWGYTGVKLSTGHVGICHSLLEEQAVRCCQIVRQAGKRARACFHLLLTSRDKAQGGLNHNRASNDHRQPDIQGLRHLCRFEKGGYCKKVKRKCEAQNCTKS